MPSKKNDTTPDKYKPLDWELNCVLQALSKVLGEGQFDLTHRLVDGKIGGLTMMKQIENNSVIKKILIELGFTQLNPGGSDWKTARQLMGALKDKGRLFAIWWHCEKKEDWTDADRKGVASDHAFAIYCNETDLEVPATNLSNFDKFHPEDVECVSVFVPSKDKLIKCDKRLVLPRFKDKEGNVDDSRGDRRFAYN